MIVEPGALGDLFLAIRRGTLTDSTLLQTDYSERQRQSPRVAGLDQPLGICADGQTRTLVARLPLPGHYNRLVEREVARLGGIKSLYSDSTFTREEFAAAYDMDAYAALKRKYDPQGLLLGLYEKCVLRE